MIVKCPNCKARFKRETEVEEFCGVCETQVSMKEVHLKKANVGKIKTKKK